MKLDGKFYGTLIKQKDNSVVPEDQWMVFLAKDNAFPATLAFYEGECIRLGAGQEQIDAVRNLRVRVEEWRIAHPDLCKVPDVTPGELRG